MIFIPIVNGSEDEQFNHFPFESSFPLISFEFTFNYLRNMLPRGICSYRPLSLKQVNKYRKIFITQNNNVLYFIYIKYFKYIYTPFLVFQF